MMENKLVFECGSGNQPEKIETDKHILKFSKMLRPTTFKEVITCPLLSLRIIKINIVFYEPNNYFTVRGKLDYN
jgi:hypothetical protein